MPSISEVEAMRLPYYRARCAATYEGQALAVLDSGWPPLAQRQAGLNPPAPSTVCYAPDLAAVDAALSAAVDALSTLSADAMQPCPPVQWPPMRRGATTCD